MDVKYPFSWVLVHMYLFLLKPYPLGDLDDKFSHANHLFPEALPCTCNSSMNLKNLKSLQQCENAWSGLNLSVSE